MYTFLDTGVVVTGRGVKLKEFCR